jgi:hypothetical protein
MERQAIMGTYVLHEHTFSCQPVLTATRLRFNSRQRALSAKRTPRLDAVLAALTAVGLLQMAFGYLLVLGICVAWIVASTGSLQLAGFVFLALWLAYGLTTIIRANRPTQAEAPPPELGADLDVSSGLDWLLVALVLGFISAWIWWRSASEPVLGGLVIAGAAVAVVLLAALIARLKR